jgi:outer membrane protein OmpU
MNKLTKIGVTALCGSLAATLSANAGDLSVTGGVDMSWMSKDDETTGNPIGIGSNLTFSGSGELDNGWTVALSIAHLNANAYSATNVTVGVPGLGDFRISQGVSGSGIDRMDDLTPNVWEEAWGTGLGTGIQLVSGVSGGANIEWTPSMTPDGLTARLSWSPNAAGGSSSDKGSSGVSASAKNSGYDVTLTATDAISGVAGLTLYGGYSSTDQQENLAAYDDNATEMTVGAKYAAGSFTLGYQWSEDDLGRATGTTEYENDAYGITFSINDDLSIGYNHIESKAAGGSANVEVDSIQLAYTMGGASIRIAEASADNMTYGTAAANDRDATTISVSLAF